MKSIKRIVLGMSLLFFTLIMTGCGEAAADVDISERIDEQETPVLTWGVKADTNLFGYYNIESGEIEGFDVDIAKALDRKRIRLNYSHVYIYYDVIYLENT